MINKSRKQLKITRLFGKNRKGSKPVEEYDDLQDEINELESKLKEKQNELFKLETSSCRKKMLPPKNKVETFIRPEKIILESSIDKLNKKLNLMTMLSGMEVQSYVANDHCCIIYHMQHDSEHEVKHGLKINLKSGVNEVLQKSFPLGFNLSAVLEDFSNINTPECLEAIRKALVTYYDRLEQFEALKSMLTLEAQLFKIMDGTHMEITFAVRSDAEESDEQIEVLLTLEYRVYDIRPKSYSFREIDLPEGMSDVLRQQCAVFKKKPLNKAFREAFIDGDGPYKLVQQSAPVRREKPRRPLKRFRPNRYDHNNDDTFHPEDCSEPSEDEDDD